VVVDNPQAIYSLTESIKNNPDFADAYLERAYAHFELGSLDEAIQDYQKSMSLRTAPLISPKSQSRHIIGAGASMKGIKLYREYKRANAAVTIQCCAQSQAKRARVIEEATKRSGARASLFKDGKVEIQWDKQNKHIPGSHNFEPGKSKITISGEELTNDIQLLVGKGERTGDVLQGAAGYRERVDFGKIIGECIYKEGAVTKTAQTSKGIIHYDSTGKIHVVPCRP